MKSHRERHFANAREWFRRLMLPSFTGDRAHVLSVIDREIALAYRS